MAAASGSNVQPVDASDTFRPPTAAASAVSVDRNPDRNAVSAASVALARAGDYVDGLADVPFTGRVLLTADVWSIELHGSASPGLHREVRFEDACSTMEAALAGPLRAAVVAESVAAGDPSLRSLRRSMLGHTFRTRAGSLRLAPLVGSWDSRTRAEGFHVLQEWDGEKFIEDPIPVLMLDFQARVGRTVPDPGSCAILLDYYLLYILALFVIRAWDEGDPGANLDRVTGLLDRLQSGPGSGMRFVDDAETLLWIAISHYEPDDVAYHRLLDKARTLDPVHRLRLAGAGATILGGHLRWGWPAYYRRDTGLMRADNVSDYPWLFFSVDVLMREFERLRDAGERGPHRDRIVAALLAGLSADPGALLDHPPPASLATVAGEMDGLRRRIRRCADDLVADIQPLRPGPVWSPIAFNFNFPHNVIIPMVTLALTEGLDEARNVSFNALLGRDSAGLPSPVALARVLADYAARNPERRGGRENPMITFDPAGAMLDFERALAPLRALR